MAGVDETVRRTLRSMIAEDAAVRARLAADGSLFDGYHAAMEAVHRRNAATLRDIVAEHGWPGRSLAGEDGAAAAWTIAQHAIGEPAFMRACLEHVRAAARRGEAEPAHAACLEDRIRVFEGRPQPYGTQYDRDDEARSMVPTGGVEDPARVDARRQAAGLPPLRWRQPPPDEPPPRDVRARRRAMEAWAGRGGWRPSREA